MNRVFVAILVVAGICGAYLFRDSDPIRRAMQPTPTPGPTRLDVLETALNSSGLVDGADARTFSERQIRPNRQIDWLVFSGRWVGDGPGDENAAARVVSLIGEHYRDYSNLDRLKIEFSQGGSYIHSREEWESLLAEVHGASLGLGEYLNGTGLIADTKVTLRTERRAGSSARRLDVRGRWVGDGPGDETAATRIAGLVLDRYGGLADTDMLGISLPTTHDVGGIAFTGSIGHIHTAAEWRARLPKPPG